MQSRRTFIKNTGLAAAVLGSGSFYLTGCKSNAIDPLDRKIRLDFLDYGGHFEAYEHVFGALKDSGLKVQLQEGTLERTLNKKPDLALVIHPLQTRATIISMLLEAGIHVITNLPLGGSFLEYDLLQALLNRQNLRISCLNPLRYLDEFRLFRSVLNKEEPQATRVAIRTTPRASIFPWDPEPQGTLGNLAYTNDLIQWLFKRPTEKIEVLEDQVQPGELFARSIHNEITVSYTVPEDPNSLYMEVERSGNTMRFGPWRGLPRLQDNPDPWLLPMYRNISDGIISLLYGLEPETGIITGLHSVVLNHYAAQSAASGQSKELIL